jgi:hypothetical protein
MSARHPFVLRRDGGGRGAGHVGDDRSHRPARRVLLALSQRAGESTDRISSS